MKFANERCSQGCTKVRSVFKPQGRCSSENFCGRLQLEEYCWVRTELKEKFENKGDLVGCGHAVSAVSQSARTVCNVAVA